MVILTIRVLWHLISNQYVLFGKGVTKRNQTEITVVFPRLKRTLLVHITVISLSVIAKWAYFYFFYKFSIQQPLRNLLCV